MLFTVTERNKGPRAPPCLLPAAGNHGAEVMFRLCVRACLCMRACMCETILLWASVRVCKYACMCVCVCVCVTGGDPHRHGSRGSSGASASFVPLT